MQIKMAAPRKTYALQTLKEYEIITLIYNRKSCKLDLLSYCAPENIILKSIQPGSTMYEGKLVGATANWQLIKIVENSLQLNPLQCGYLFNIQFNYLFGLLGNNIILFFESFGNLNRSMQTPNEFSGQLKGIWV